MKQHQRLQNRVKDFLFPEAANAFWRKRLYGKVICLLYHRVDSPDNNAYLTQGGSPVISPGELELELRFLKRQRATFLTFADLRSGAFPDRSEYGVIVSFDDCFLDNYTHGLEVLESLGIKATFFQTTGMLQADELIWEHSLYWFSRNSRSSQSFSALAHRVLGRIPGVRERHGTELVAHLREDVASLSVKELVACAKEEMDAAGELAVAAQQVYATAGHVRKALILGHEIGSHGHQHFKRANIDERLFEKELATSVETLTSLVGARPQAFSYPFNSYRNGDEAICARYVLQAATVDGKHIKRDTDPMWLPRFTWPGAAKSPHRRRRWLLTGRI